MRTTLDLNDHLMKQAKTEAVKRGVSLTRLIELALDRELHVPPKPKEPFTWPVVQDEKWDPPFDFNSRVAMYDWFDANPDEEGK